MIRAVLFDRDGTLIADRRDTLSIMPGAAAAISLLRERGMRIGVVTNQPRAGSSSQAREQMEALHARIDALAGPIDGWFVCTHLPEDACSYRKPEPGLILQAANAFGVSPAECVVIGDIGSDVEAAARAGARAILVPTPVTRAQEIEAAPIVCRDLYEAARLVLKGEQKRVLVARQDNNGDVLLTGPAVRAIAASAEVTMLCGPRGAAAARMLPCIEEVIVREAEWIDAQPQAIDRAATLRFVDDIASRGFSEAVIFTSFHQSALPLALLLRMAGVGRIGAISVDYPGSLLDVRHNVDDGVHEVERALSLVRAMGYDLPAGEDRALRLRDAGVSPLPFTSYVVVHPGSTAPARAWFPERNAELVTRLCELGYNVAVTGSNDERELTAFVAGGNARALDVGGKTTFAEFAAIVRDADAVICGNTAAVHVAAAMKTPVVEIFPPTIPAARFHPWMVPYEILGNQEIACKGCRARVCPFDGQPCLNSVRVEDVVRALERVARVEAYA
ncbi:MAG TPA: HAD-IIIA family hydrolase [Candidatus Baltobacteraceae bacterium]